MLYIQGVLEKVSMVMMMMMIHRMHRYDNTAFVEFDKLGNNEKSNSNNNSSPKVNTYLNKQRGPR